MKNLENLLVGISAISIFSLTSLVFVSVFFRYVLSAPILMTDDLMSILLGLTVFSALPAVTANRKHVKVELVASLIDRISFAKKLRTLLIDLISLFVVGLLGHQLFSQTVKYLDRETTSTTMEWIMWPVIAAFAALTGVAFALLAIRIVSDRLPGNLQETEND